MYDGSRSHDLRFHRTALYQLSYIHHISTNKGYRTQWRSGYEPEPETFPIGIFEESSGNDPQSVSHRSHCLANKSRRLQGLLSIECGTTAVVEASTQVIPLFVFTTGYDPITFCVSDKHSTNWATWTGTYLGVFLNHPLSSSADSSVTSRWLRTR